MSRKIYIPDDMALDMKMVDIADISPESAMMWPWVLTYLDDWGRGISDPRRIKGKTFSLFAHVTLESIALALKLYCDFGLMECYEVDGVGYFRVAPEKWFKYQTHIAKEKRVDDSASKIPSPRFLAISSDSPRFPAESCSSPSPSPSPSPSLPLSPSPSSATDPFAPEGTEYKPSKIDLKAILADRPHWAAWLDANRPSPEPGKTSEGFDRWKVCQWLNGKEYPPPVPPPPPAESAATLLPAIFKGCLGPGFSDEVTLRYLAQTKQAMLDEKIWSKEDYSHETHGGELIARTIQRYNLAGRISAGQESAA